ncbi:T9SS type A sorting domain-containing protein [Spirosoma sp.]|uniref:T9SS type A sorting domain-containing protein n=1 Tax=Spirosoma sp. TaxID=1899569 RepID=UPI003B3BA43B
MTLSYSKVVDIYNTTTNQWSTAQLSQERFYIGAASAGGKILFAGGAVFNNVCSCYINYNTVDVYDATTNQWSVTQLPNLQGSLLATSTANKILFTKNEGGNGLIDIYDVITGQWTTATIPQAQPASAVISVGYKVLFAAGTSFASQIHIYDVVTNQWTTATLSQARRGFAVVNMGSKVFFAGGVSSPSYANSNVVDIYDASTNQWSTTQLPQTAGDLRGTTAGNKVLFADQATGKVDIYTLNDVLPVNLIAFSGKWTENLGAQLNWTTSLETNNDHFQIQRSSDAKTFETIGRVAGKGITKERSDYSFTDAATPDPVNYYRLKQVDLDGSVHFSTIISITRQSDNQSIKLSVWPSPTTGTLTLELTGGKTIQQVGVYDLHGRKLTSQVGAQATADVAGLPTGAYVVEVLTTDGQQLRSRFVKQ